MALKKIKNYKGMNCEYWRINQFSYDDITDTAIVSLWLYVNQEATINLSENTLIREVLTIKGIKQVEITPEIIALNLNPRDLLKRLMYIKLKESKKEMILDENNQEVEVETNFFADSEDC